MRTFAPWTGPITLFLSTTSLAQVPQIPPTTLQGPASRVASALSLNHHVGTSDTFWLRSPAVGASLLEITGATPLSGIPDYRLSTLFPNFPTIQLDAISTGNAVIPDIDPSGGLILDDPGGGDGYWFGLVCSVTNGSMGAPGSVLNSLKTGGHQLGSDLVSHYWEGSAGFAQYYAGSTMLETASEDFGFTGTEDIDGLDYALGVQYYSPAQGQILFFDVEGEFYFSVSKEWALTGEASTFGSLPGGADPAAIYWMTWTGTRWSDVMVYRTREQLGLTISEGEEFDLEDVDALDVDSARDRLVFSTQPVEGRAQILVQDDINPPLTLMANATDSADDALGLTDDDDADGLCAFDPEATHVYDPRIGVPVENFPATPMGLCVMRYEDPAQPGVARLMLEVSGFGGAPTPLSSRYQLKVFTNTQGASQPSWTMLSSHTRLSSQQTYQIEYPLSSPIGDVGFYVGLYEQGPNGNLVAASVQSYIQL